MPTWLVTGGSGFLGRHVLEQMRRSADPGDTIFAVGRRLPLGWPVDRFESADLGDPIALGRAVARVRPDLVLHLAGRTPPAEVASFYRENVGGTVGLLRALRDLGRPCRVVTAGSAAELGPVPADRLPADERTPCRPDGPYGLSKWFASRATRSAAGPIEGIAARIFNPIGPGMPTSQAFGRFAALLSAGGPGPLTLRLGPLDARRDFIDARDVADALIALARRGRAGRIYHVGSGRSVRIADGLDRLVALSGRRVSIEPVSGPATGPGDSRADISSIFRDTGWAPRIPLDRSLADLWASVSSTPIRRSSPDHPGIPEPLGLRHLLASSTTDMPPGSDRSGPSPCRDRGGLDPSAASRPRPRE